MMTGLGASVGVVVGGRVAVGAHQQVTRRRGAHELSAEAIYFVVCRRGLSLLESE